MRNYSGIKIAKNRKKNLEKDLTWLDSIIAFARKQQLSNMPKMVDDFKFM